MAQRKTSFDGLPLQEWPAELQLTWTRHLERCGWGGRKTNMARRSLELIFRLVGPMKPWDKEVQTFKTRLGQDLAAASVLTRLRSLYDGLLILWPDQNWSWVNDVVKAERQAHWAAHPNWSVHHRRGPRAKKADPMRLPLECWPEDIRAVWKSLLPTEGRSTGKYRPSGVRSPLAGLSPAYIARIERGMGRYLAFANKEGLDACPTPESMDHYIAAEQTHGSAEKSVSSYVFEIWRCATQIWPDLNWHWLGKLADALEKAGKPVRLKLTGQVPTARLRKLGHSLMNEAFIAPPSERNIIKFRDGLIMALMTHKPMRAKNLAALSLDDLFFDEVGGVSLLLGQTKNRRDDLVYLGNAELAGAFKHWIEDLRPRLNPKGTGAALWVGRFGNRLTGADLSVVARRRTKSALGVAVSLHRFRDAVTMTIARHDPENMGVASKLLGHKDSQSVAAYEGIARSTGAANVLDDILTDYTKPPAIKRKV